jgi:hypothetical protein
MLLGWLLPLPAQQPPTASPRATVVAGTGEPPAQAVATIDQLVAAELPSLLRIFSAAQVDRPFFVHVHESRAALPAALAAHLDPDSPAFAVLGAHQIHIVWGEVVRMGASPRGVVRHELVHELLDQYAAPHGRQLPRWFHEGLAQHLAGDTYLRASEDDLVWGMGLRRLEPFGALRSRFPTEPSALRSAYAQSFSYVSWLAREYGVAELLAIVRAVGPYTTFEAALVGRTGRSTLQLEDAWRHHVLHGSGAPWRVLLDQCFSYCLIALLPVLVVALIRRLRAEGRAAGELARREAAAAAAEPAPPPAEVPQDRR